MRPAFFGPDRRVERQPVGGLAHIPLANVVFGLEEMPGMSVAQALGLFHHIVMDPTPRQCCQMPSSWRTLLQPLAGLVNTRMSWSYGSSDGTLGRRDEG